MVDVPKPEELIKVDNKPPAKGWMDVPPDISAGKYPYPAQPKSLKYLDLPNPRDWSPLDDDWQLPENWKEIVH